MIKFVAFHFKNNRRKFAFAESEKLIFHNVELTRRAKRTIFLTTDFIYERMNERNNLNALTNIRKSFLLELLLDEEGEVIQTDWFINGSLDDRQNEVTECLLFINKIGEIFKFKFLQSTWLINQSFMSTE